MLLCRNDLRCYDIIWRATRFIEIPNSSNKYWIECFSLYKKLNRVRESKIWYAKQPGHIMRADFYNAADYLKSFAKGQQHAPWVIYLKGD